jgi:hypothetical protein
MERPPGYPQEIHEYKHEYKPVSRRSAAWFFVILFIVAAFILRYAIEQLFGL